METVSESMEFAPAESFARARRLQWQVVGGLCLAVLVAFTYTASVVDHFPGEVAVSSWVQSWQTSWLDTVMKAVSPDHRFVTAPMVIIVALALFLKGMRTEGGLIVLVTMLSFITVSVLKAVVARPRPPAELVQVFEQADGYLFPSGHVMHYAVFLGTLGIMLWIGMRPGLGRWLVQGSVAAVLVAMGLSRIYLGVHWPTDVVAGYAVGAIIVAGAIWALRWWNNRRGQITGPDQLP